MEKFKKITRRDFMAAAGGTLVSIGLPGVFVKLMDSENRALAAELRPDGRPRIPPGQHAVKELPNMGGTRGSKVASDWHLEISGEVENPRTLKYSDLMELKQVDLTCDVHYFYKSVKWIQAIRFASVDEPGYYENSGYSNSADPWKEERFD